jgi:hypothetical protein
MTAGPGLQRSSGALPAGTSREGGRRWFGKGNAVSRGANGGLGRKNRGEGPLAAQGKTRKIKLGFGRNEESMVWAIIRWRRRGGSKRPGAFRPKGQIDPWVVFSIFPIDPLRRKTNGNPSKWTSFGTLAPFPFILRKFRIFLMERTQNNAYFLGMEPAFRDVFRGNRRWPGRPFPGKCHLDAGTGGGNGVCDARDFPPNSPDLPPAFPPPSQLAGAARRPAPAGTHFSCQSPRPKERP